MTFSAGRLVGHSVSAFTLNPILKTPFPTAPQCRAGRRHRDRYAQAAAGLAGMGHRRNARRKRGARHGANGAMKGFLRFGEAVIAILLLLVPALWNRFPF